MRYAIRIRVAPFRFILCALNRYVVKPKGRKEIKTKIILKNSVKTRTGKANVKLEQPKTPIAELIKKKKLPPEIKI